MEIIHCVWWYNTLLFHGHQLNFKVSQAKKLEWNGLKFDIRMYPDQLQNWLDFHHGLFIFLILVAFNLAK